MRRELPSPPPQEWYEAREWPDRWPGDLRGKSVLDLGCGQGWIGWLAQQSGALVVATDIFREACHLDLPFLLASKEALPLPDECLDVVLCANVLHHGNLEATVSEVFRVLRNGGRFISLQEPCIPLKLDEDEYLAQHCAGELSNGIDERRPKGWEYWATLRPFRELDFWTFCGDPREPASKVGEPIFGSALDQFHGGLRIECLK